MAPELHRRLRAAAQRDGLSLNELCSRRLAGGPGPVEQIEGLREAVEWALGTFETRLVAVAAFGSWARGETADGSDVDVLVVLERRVRLSRSLYRKWDQAPLALGGRAIDVSFAHLPPVEETVAGIWAEVAVDGVVLLDVDLRLSRRLVRVRHDVVEGRIVRRTAHGQGYWIDVQAA